jgi:hypothetical protein
LASGAPILRAAITPLCRNVDRRSTGADSLTSTLSHAKQVLSNVWPNRRPFTDPGDITRDDQQHARQASIREEPNP